jgi:hypothetical protein
MSVVRCQSNSWQGQRASGGCRPAPGEGTLEPVRVDQLPAPHKGEGVVQYQLPSTARGASSWNPRQPAKAMTTDIRAGHATICQPTGTGNSARFRPRSSEPAQAGRSAGGWRFPLQPTTFPIWRMKTLYRWSRDGKSLRGNKAALSFSGAGRHLRPLQRGLGGLPMT